MRSGLPGHRILGQRPGQGAQRGLPVRRGPPERRRKANGDRPDRRCGGAFRDVLARREASTPISRPTRSSIPTGPWARRSPWTARPCANKGLELIEAQWLFGLRPDQCTAIPHPLEPRPPPRAEDPRRRREARRMAVQPSSTIGPSRYPGHAPPLPSADRFGRRRASDRLHAPADPRLPPRRRRPLPDDPACPQRSR